MNFFPLSLTQSHVFSYSNGNCIKIELQGADTSDVPLLYSCMVLFNTELIMHLGQTSFSVHNIKMHMAQFVLMPVPWTGITWLRGHCCVLYSKSYFLGNFLTSWYEKMFQVHLHFPSLSMESSIFLQ